MNIIGFQNWGIGLLASLAILMAGQSAASAAEGDRLPETPDEYVQYALEQNSELRSLYQRRQARLSEAEAAGAKWPQPTVAYRTFIDGWWLDNHGTRHRVMFGQRFPWPGVLDQAAEPARKQAEAIEHRFEARALEVVFEVRRLLVEIARLDAIEEILVEQKRVYGDIARILEGQMGSDTADYGDLVRINRTEEQLADRIDVVDSKRAQAVAELRGELEVGPEVDLTFDFSGEHDVLAVDEELAGRAKLVERARRNHPSLQARRVAAEANVAMAERARLEKYPWPRLMLGVDSIPDHMMLSGYNRRTALMIDLQVPLPLFQKQYDQKTEQFEHLREATLAERDRTSVGLVAEIDRALTRIAEKRRRLRRYEEELLPLAGDATEYMRQQIETGGRDVTDYLLSFQQELDLETNLVEFRAAIAVERARIEKLTGGATEFGIEEAGASDGR